MTISKKDSDRITVSFPYSPSLVQRIKSIEGRKWHPDKKYWTDPYSEGVIEKFLEVFDKGRNSIFDRGGISETGSDIIPNLDKKRNKDAFVNKLGDILLGGEKEVMRRNERKREVFS